MGLAEGLPVTGVVYGQVEQGLRAADRGGDVNPAAADPLYRGRKALVHLAGDLVLRDATAVKPEFGLAAGRRPQATQPQTGSNRGTAYSPSSVSWKQTATGWPTERASGSSVTMLVSSRGPSTSST